MTNKRPTPGKFRKKGIAVEAVQYFDWMRQQDCLPRGVVIAHWPEHGDMPTIRALEGDHIVSEGDWIITGVKGEKYPCKPGIFAATYEPAETVASTVEAQGERIRELEQLLRGIIDYGPVCFGSKLRKGCFQNWIKSAEAALAQAGKSVELQPNQRKERQNMSGPELIEWLARECNFRKLPPTDSAMIILLRELPDIEVWVNTIKHQKQF